MKTDVKRIFLSAFIPLLLLLTIYLVKIIEVAGEVDLAWMGIYPMQAKGVLGIITHPLVHSGFKHLWANTLSLFFLTWCLFYFYRDLSYLILLVIWIGCGSFIFLMGKPGWHVGASGVIYGLAFFLFFSGLLRRQLPLIAISLLITFLYGSMVWQMFPHFTASNISWEGHFGGAISGTIAAFAFLHYGPQRPQPIDEDDEEESDDEELNPLITDEMEIK